MKMQDRTGTKLNKLSRKEREGGRVRGASTISRSLTPTMWSASIISTWWLELDTPESSALLSRRTSPAARLARHINNRDPNNRSRLGTLGYHVYLIVCLQKLLPHSAPSWILSQAENLASSSLQDGATKWYYFL